MAFIDELKIYMKAGNGGNGVVRWLRAKNNPKGGPAGGNGGKGANVYAIGVRDISLLSKYTHNPEFLAENGEDGQKNSLEGKNGEDLIVEFPIGSVLTAPGEEYEILEEGQKILLLEGGKGGLGNEHFKSSTNVSPTEFTYGKKVEGKEFFVELKLVVDAGFIGLPSSGKSSLLNALTNAKAKVGEYHFTTLEPNLGNLYGFTLADIPGLIEGASEGKGLGHKFLRHIQRTKMIFHLISMEGNNPLENYEVIRKELENYDKELSKKKEIIILSKTDLVSKEEIERVKKEFEKSDKKVLISSILDDNLIKSLSEEIVKLLG
jgi:GTP-binding protein